MSKIKVQKIKSFSTEAIHNSKEYPISIVKDAIKKHVKRLKDAKVKLSNEFYALKLEKKAIQEFLDNPETANLVAFFGVDPEDNNGTVFIASLNSKGKVVKDGTVYHARERWDKVFGTAADVDTNPGSLDKVFP